MSAKIRKFLARDRIGKDQIQEKEQSTRDNAIES
jgi:hypothetical protein